MSTEPHSTKQIEDCVGWGLGDRAGARWSTPTPASTRAPRELPSVCAAVRVPGAGDPRRRRPHPPPCARRRAGGAHRRCARHHRRRRPRRRTPRPGVRQPADRGVRRAGRTRRAAADLDTGARRPKRALYISSPIGLGHARRDVAIADELRTLHPDLQIDWLAQHPVTALLERRAASASIRRRRGWPTSRPTSRTRPASTTCTRSRRSAGWTRSSSTTSWCSTTSSSDEHYDLVIGDEAWDVDYFLHENPELKRFAFAWMTDFVGWLPMPDGGDAEAALTADYNAEMIEQRARFRRVRDRSIFVGDPDDIVPDASGPACPAIREWTDGELRVLRLRHRLRPGRVRRPRARCGPSSATGPTSGCASSPSAAPASAATCCAASSTPCPPPAAWSTACASWWSPVHASTTRAPPAQGVSLPPVRPRALPPPRRLRPRRRAGGLTTCMELTANRRPFVYVPLQHHFEQNFHVHHRLQRYGAGRRLDYDEAADPDSLAKVIADEIGRTVDYRPSTPTVRRARRVDRRAPVTERAGAGCGRRRLAGRVSVRCRRTRIARTGDGCGYLRHATPRLRGCPLIVSPAIVIDADDHRRTDEQDRLSRLIARSSTPAPPRSPSELYLSPQHSVHGYVKAVFSQARRDDAEASSWRSSSPSCTNQVHRDRVIQRDRRRRSRSPERPDTTPIVGWCSGAVRAEGVAHDVRHRRPGIDAPAAAWRRPGTAATFGRRVRVSCSRPATSRFASLFEGTHLDRPGWRSPRSIVEIFATVASRARRSAAAGALRPCRRARRRRASTAAADVTLAGHRAPSAGTARRCSCSA